MGGRRVGREARLGCARRRRRPAARRARRWSNAPADSARAAEPPCARARLRMLGELRAGWSWLLDLWRARVELAVNSKRNAMRDMRPGVLVHRLGVQYEQVGAAPLCVEDDRQQRAAVLARALGSGDENRLARISAVLRPYTGFAA